MGSVQQVVQKLFYFVENFLLDNYNIIWYNIITVKDR